MKTKTFSFMGKRYFVRGKTEKEAKQKMLAKRAELEEKAAAGKLHTCITLDEWFGIYMRTYKADILESTVKCYEGLYRRSIAPLIGKLPLDAIKPIQCQQAINACAGLSDSSIRKTYILLRSLFEKAYENDYIERIPTKALTRPKGPTKERRALSEGEREAFIKASDNGRNSGLFCRIIFYCGLRPSEVLRIKGGDYDGRILHVRGTKTKSATRDVPIPEALTLPDLPEDRLMFCTKSGTPIDKKRIREYWLAVKRDMGCLDSDLTLYCLRHDYCTRLEEAGVPLNIASRLMGHSSVEITSKIYTHASTVTLEKAEALINQYFDHKTESQKSHKTAVFGGNLPNISNNEKTPKPLEFQGFRGASWAIRTPNLLIRRGPKVVRFSVYRRIYVIKHHENGHKN